MDFTAEQSKADSIIKGENPDSLKIITEINNLLGYLKRRRYEEQADQKKANELYLLDKCLSECKMHILMTAPTQGAD